MLLISVPLDETDFTMTFRSAQSSLGHPGFYATYNIVTKDINGRTSGTTNDNPTENGKETENGKDSGQCLVRLPSPQPGKVLTRMIFFRDEKVFFVGLTVI